MEFARASEAAAFLRTQVRELPEIAVICGSGLGGFADRVMDPKVVPTASVPHMKASTVQGHAGRLVFGHVGSARVVAVQGRLHTYEGHSIHDTTRIVRVLALLGVKTLVVTNAAGGINANFRVGDLMVISDHLNIPGMTGKNPLCGPNEAGFGGPRFLPTNDVYPHGLRHAFFTIADAHKLGRSVHEGTYAMLTGPTYESAAEVRFLRTIGADAVGMSSVPEAIVAVHSGMTVFGLSLITNVAIEAPPRSGRLPPTTDKVEEPDHEEVVAVAGEAARDVELLISEFVQKTTAK